MVSNNILLNFARIVCTGTVDLNVARGKMKCLLQVGERLIKIMEFLRQGDSIVGSFSVLLR